LCEWTGVNGFRRTPQSGGFNKSYKTKVGEREFASDIMCEQPVKFTIEIKSEDGFSLDALMNSDTAHTCKFTSWWFQTNCDAINVKKFPLLWFKPVPNWDWVALSQEGVKALAVPESVTRIDINAYKGPVTKTRNNEDGVKTEITIPLPNPVIFRWKDIKADVNGLLLFE
ncbi:MAG: hypothetical protein QF535_15255, partial [Anaerolineales bacterium]|nr:hypothetical protein [Anaerolineales bacterium]